MYNKPTDTGGNSEHVYLGRIFCRIADADGKLEGNNGNQTSIHATGENHRMLHLKYGGEIEVETHEPKLTYASEVWWWKWLKGWLWEDNDGQCGG